ncbi:MAG TPA: HNH endonuclease signature motif containing protein [Actinomycetaceae bacterium]|nr:HNH endonuclease signature motif containing protein [Actinomycetaceae bacterium]
MNVEQVMPLLGATISLILDHPWALVPLIVAAMVCAILASPAGGATEARDPRRAFTAAERREAFKRAGLRCEHKPLLWHRCTNTPTQGDHIYPWSKGGRTTMSNQQAMCPFHNARKSGSVPTRMYIYRLQWRRRRYFPDGVSTQVEWRAGAAI